MARRIEFKIPDGMTPTQVAQALSAYLNGCNAYESKPSPPYGWHNGPQYLDPKAKDKDHSWMLHSNNDFWLHVEDKQSAAITCRYDGREEKIIATAIELFNLMYNRNDED